MLTTEAASINMKFFIGFAAIAVCFAQSSAQGYNFELGAPSYGSAPSSYGSAPSSYGAAPTYSAPSYKVINR